MWQTSAGERRTRVTLANPGTPTSDGQGGFTETYTALSPSTSWVSVEPATERSLERLSSGSVRASATHIVRGPYHAQVTTKTRLTLDDGRQLFVSGKTHDDRLIEMVLFCDEAVG